MNIRSISFFIFSVLVISGCASQTQTRDIHAINAQMEILTDEMIRLDQNLNTTRQEIAAKEAKLQELELQLQQKQAQLQSAPQQTVWQTAPQTTRVVQQQAPVQQVIQSTPAPEPVVSQIKPTEPLDSVYRTPGGFELSSLSIQKALRKAGYYKGEVDGKIGPGSRSAIRKFQSDNDLKADGIVGKKTWELLKVYA